MVQKIENGVETGLVWGFQEYGYPLGVLIIRIYNILGLYWVSPWETIKSACLGSQSENRGKGVQLWRFENYL